MSDDDSKPAKKRTKRPSARSSRANEVKRARQLQEEYSNHAADAERLLAFMRTQVHAAITQNGVTLGFPVESRVKDISSILEKVSRKNKPISSVTDFDDFAGLRIVVLFKRDLNIISNFIINTFNIISKEDTADRLGESNFGYQSKHFVVSLPDQWHSLPSLTGLFDSRVEIQVRTIAQHIWAATSHKLQYKSESTIPLEIRRAISRASAVLELVDLEFDRVLNERDAYISKLDSEVEDRLINVDILTDILTKRLPRENMAPSELYSSILKELNKLGVTTSTQLEEMISRNIEKALQEDEDHSQNENLMEFTHEILASRGKYFSHTGLIRNIMRFEFGTSVADEIISDYGED